VAATGGGTQALSTQLHQIRGKSETVSVIVGGVSLLYTHILVSLKLAIRPIFKLKLGRNIPAMKKTRDHERKLNYVLGRFWGRDFTLQFWSDI